jgi:hypothetical protein
MRNLKKIRRGVAVVRVMQEECVSVNGSEIMLCQGQEGYLS